LKRAQNESAVLITLFPGLPRSAHEEISRIFFERLNFAAVSVLERPMAQIYAANALAGVVVDIGRVHTDITPVYDGVPLPAARCTLPVGADDCERHLAHLLRANTAVMAALADTPPAELQPALVALARDAWQGGLIKVGEAAVLAEDDGVTDIAAVLVAGKEKAVIESGMKKRANAKATAAERARARELEALDLVTLQFRGQELTLGKERHRFCDPLFSPGVLQGVPEGPGSMLPLAQRLAKANVDSPAQLTSLQDLVGHAVGLVDVDQRQYIYQGLFVTGAICAQVKGLSLAVAVALVLIRIAIQDLGKPYRPAYLRSSSAIRISRTTYNLAPSTSSRCRNTLPSTARSATATLLSSVQALSQRCGHRRPHRMVYSCPSQITFHDTHSKNFVAKADYLAKGPRAIIEMSPAML
jgi:actin-related protein 9